MGSAAKQVWRLVVQVMHWVSFGAVVTAALGLIAASVLSATGVWPWLSLDMHLGDQPVENAGMYLQLGVTALAVMLAFFLPSSGRIMALENSHRNFTISMDDVARAYHIAHAGDRADNFRLSAEFDAVRERLSYLRDHPDLGALEPALLETAAQMSYISRELSDVYSDENVTRARDFLRQRQHELEKFNDRMQQAKGVVQEIKQWVHQVELDESVAASQLTRLQDELNEILPELGRETTQAPEDDTIVGLPRAAE